MKKNLKLEHAEKERVKINYSDKNASLKTKASKKKYAINVNKGFSREIVQVATREIFIECIQ